MNSITAPAGRSTKICHDAVGRPAVSTQPNQTSIAMGYDPNGNVITGTLDAQNPGQSVPGGRNRPPSSVGARCRRSVEKILMKPPIILDNEGDMVAFDTVSDALNYAEPVEVESNECDAFDSEGRRLTLGVDGEGRHGNKRVIITQAEEPPRHEAELRRRVIDFLRRTGTVMDPDTKLDLLVNALAARGGHRG